MIVDTMINNFSDSLVSKTDRYRAMVYAPLDDGLLEHVMSSTRPGKTVFLFSGSWNLCMDAMYVELRCFKDCALPWHPNTLFLEPEQKNFYHYVLAKCEAQNFIILHSDYWLAHRPLADIMSDLSDLNQIAPRVICTLPLKHTNFNKMTTSISDLLDRWPQITLFNNSLVITFNAG